jgi:hypothetical protein
MDIEQIRRARLRSLIDDRFGGTIAAFACEVGRQGDYFSRVLSGKKGFGEALARDI